MVSRCNWTKQSSPQIIHINGNYKMPLFWPNGSQYFLYFPGSLLPLVCQYGILIPLGLTPLTKLKIWLFNNKCKFPNPSLFYKNYINVSNGEPLGQYLVQRSYSNFHIYIPLVNWPLCNFSYGCLGYHITFLWWNHPYQYSISIIKNQYMSPILPYW